MELIIALEMSRLQMIEDRIKQATTIAPEQSSSIAKNYMENNDELLKLAIQLSLQDSSKPNILEQPASSIIQEVYQKTNADITVDNFLKSLANKKIDLENFEENLNMLNNDVENGWLKIDKECCFKPCSENEDGRFQISDIHENGFAFADDDEYLDDDIRLKRSHSTGDLCVRRSGRGARVRMNGDELQYHLDSDHSIQHDDKPEEDIRRKFVLPKSMTKTRNCFLFQSSGAEDVSYEEHSSVDETTTSDSINVDTEMSGIVELTTDDEAKNKSTHYITKWNPKFLATKKVDNCVPAEIKKTENISKKEEVKKQNPFASLKAKLCSAHLSKTNCLTKMAVNKSIGLLSEPKLRKDKEVEHDSKIQNDVRRHSDHSIAWKQKFPLTCPTSENREIADTLYKAKEQTTVSKSTSFLLDAYSNLPKSGSKHCSANLQIKISNNNSAPKGSTIRVLETDSSNEYESETGIPKSPTLFISGVSISRTPEPKSPGLSIALNGRQSRSSSLSVPVPLSTCSLNISNDSLSNTVPPEPFTPSLVRSTTPIMSRSNLQSSPKHTPSQSIPSGKENSKSKSASEPEREKEVFRFPKSSTDGALSSVLHVQESNLSSDDFHEALFLLERSPKSRDSKRRKRSKKKEKDERKEEASSAL